MRRNRALRVGIVLLGLILLVPGVAWAQDGVPEAHTALTEFEGPQTCATCHMTAAQEVVESLHYQQQASAPFLEGADDEINYGMYVTY